MSQQGGFMLSRLAEHLYWMGRYIERCENTARLVSVYDHLQLDGLQATDWKPLIDMTGEDPLFRDLYGPDAPYDEQRVLRFLLTEVANPGSMISSLELARENTRVLRALLPREAWETVTELTLETRSSKSQGLERRSRDAFLKRTVRECQALVGLLDGTMNHDAGFRFLELGRLIERAEMTTRIIDIYSRTVLAVGQDPAGVENNHWVPVLRSVAAYQMYRQRRQARVRRFDALDFLIRDRVFPRSCLYCLNAAEQAIRQLPNPSAPSTSVRRAAKMLRDARLSRFAHDPMETSEFLDRVQIEIGQVHSSVAANWFLT